MRSWAVSRMSVTHAQLVNTASIHQALHVTMPAPTMQTALKGQSWFRWRAIGIQLLMPPSFMHAPTRQPAGLLLLSNCCCCCRCCCCFSCCHCADAVRQLHSSSAAYTAKPLRFVMIPACFCPVLSDATKLDWNVCSDTKGGISA